MIPSTNNVAERGASRPSSVGRPLVGAFAILVALVALSVGSSAEAQRQGKNPYDAHVQKLAKQAEKRGASASAAIPLIELLSVADEVSPAVYAATLERLRKNRRLSPAVRAYVERAAADVLTRRGDIAASEKRYDELGFIRDFRVIGPFDNEGRQGFAKAQGPETKQQQPVDLGAAYAGRERSVSWRPYPDIVRRGYVDFDAVLRPRENVCGIAETFVHVATARPLVFWLGSGGANRLYINGQSVLEDPVYRGPSPDRAAVRVSMAKGWNRVVVKSCVARQAWGFFLRVTEADLSPAVELQVDPNPSAAAGGSAGAEQQRFEVVPTVLSELEAEVKRSPTSARAHYELAAFLVLTGSEDAAEGRSRQLAQRAAELDDAVEHLLLAARTAETRAERMRFADQADRVAARDARVRLYRAALAVSGPDGDRALRMLEGLRPTTVEGMKALEIRSQLLSSIGLRRASAAELEQLGKLGGDAPAALVRRKAAADRRGHRATSRAIIDDVLRVDAGQNDLRQTLIRIALERGEKAEATAHLERMIEMRPGDPGVLYYAAGIYDGLGDREQSLALHRRVVDLAPDEADAHVRLADALVRHGRRDEAAQAYRVALRLRPQDAGTRQSLERIRPSSRPDELHATPVQEILKRRRGDPGWPATVLHDLTVNTVYPNGLSSTFRQLAFQVHSVEGARSWDSYSVRYEPESQWVDVRSARIYRADGRVVESVSTTTRTLGDPRYRIYYDTRALVILLPDLEPGDTVELRYRVEDASRRNAFNDYYGTLQFLQGFAPMARMEYVVVSPKSRTLHFNEPPLKGLQYERKESATDRIDRWTANDVPALRREPRMPGMTDIAPYLHISTYRSWQDVGRWWWGLIQEQLHMDAALKRTVAEVTAGAPDVETKVKRIYAWVVKNTRYVGLEFGIHGFKPYRVTQVVQRGFGDCKDKASLLYVMLQEAGIDARIALVRTRSNGSIPDHPASLAVFDHAIAYVPELDLFLDGTAETSGALELPAGDQGVTTLIVGPKSAEMRKIPLQPPTKQGRERTLVAKLQPDGAAEVQGKETIRGTYASPYRTAYQAVETRKERLQREIGSNFPGAEITSQSFSPLHDFDQPVAFEFAARVPNWAQRSGRELQLAPSVMEGLLQSLAPSGSRIHPLDLGPPTGYSESREVQLPRGLQVRRLPKGGSATSPYGKLSVRYEQRDDSVIATTSLQMLRDRVSPAEYGEFRKWVEEADSLLRERVTVGGAQ